MTDDRPQPMSAGELNRLSNRLWERREGRTSMSSVLGEYVPTIDDVERLVATAWEAMQQLEREHVNEATEWTRRVMAGQLRGDNKYLNASIALSAVALVAKKAREVCAAASDNERHEVIEELREELAKFDERVARFNEMNHEPRTLAEDLAAVLAYHEDGADGPVPLLRY